MKTPYDVIIRPVLTEASYDNMADRKYTFVVAKTANKTEIKQALEQVFGVKVAKVNTSVRPGKPKRMGRFAGVTATTKRAIVKLAADSKGIEFFDSLT